MLCFLQALVVIEIKYDMKRSFVASQNIYAATEWSLTIQINARTNDDFVVIIEEAEKPIYKVNIKKSLKRVSVKCNFCFVCDLKSCNESKWYI